MVFAAGGKMNVPAHCPGGLLPGDQQGELATAGIGFGDQGLSRRFMVQDQTRMTSGIQGMHMAIRGVWQTNDGDSLVRSGAKDFRVIVHGDKVIHFERVKPPFVFGELTKDGKFIFPNGNSGNQYRVIAGQIMIARAKGNWNLHLHQHLHPFIDIDQLWNDAFRMKHIQQVSGDADQVVAIGDT